MGLETVTYISDLNADWPLGSLPDKKSEGDNHLRNIKLGIKNTFPNVTSAVTPTHTELNFVDGVTSPIQGQLDAKAPSAGPTFTGTVTLPATTSIGLVSDAEIGCLDGVTSAIQTQLNGKGAIAGQAWSGAHDFTGGTLRAATLPAGTATTEVATTAHVASVAFSAALPGQTGNAGKFARTNGTDASWSDLVDTPIVISTNTAAVVCRTYVLTATLTLTLPASPANGEWVEVVNRSGVETPVVARNGNNIQGLAEDMTINTINASIRLTFVTGQGWVIK